MKRKFLISFAVGIFAWFLPWTVNIAFGGATVGNGGDAVVCRSQDIILSVQVLDLYEARKVRSIRWQVPTGLNDPYQILDFVLDRYSAVDPKRAEDYRARVSTFEEEARFIEDRLIDIPDHGEQPLRPDCAIEQFVVQRAPRFPEDKRYLVQAAIWNHLKTKQNYLQLAAIMLHEVVYADFMAHGHNNSEAARYFNSVLFAGTFNSYSRDQYMNLLMSLGLEQ